MAAPAFSFRNLSASVLALSLVAAQASALEAIVNFKDGIPTAEVLAFAEVLDGIPSTGTYLVRIGDDQLERLRESDGVKYAEPNEHFQDLRCLQSVIWMDDYAPPLYPNLPPVAPDAVRLALLDSALDKDHVTYHHQLDPGIDLVDWDLDCSLPPAVVNLPAEQALPGYLHATATAGAVASIAPGVRIVPYRVMDDLCRGSSFRLAQGIIWAVDAGARVLLLPLGGPETKSLGDAIDYAADHDVVIVVSAGNDGGMIHNKLATGKDVVTVAAVDANGSPASFTSYSPKVDLSDYGVAIETSYPGGRRAYASGTSFAAARTAGAAAALRYAFPELSADKIVEKLKHTAAPLGPRPSNRKNKLGDGITDLEAALAAEQ